MRNTLSPIRESELALGVGVYYDDTSEGQPAKGARDMPESTRWFQRVQQKRASRTRLARCQFLI